VRSASAGRPADAERTRAAVIDSPYRGLKAFEEQDAAFFFGREAATTALLERMSRRLEGTSLVLVSGASGAGKSSLLRAGVLPQVRKAGLAGAPGAAAWPCLVLTPTRAPLDELALRVGLLAGSDAAGVRRGLDTDPAGFALTARQAALAQRRGPAEEPENPRADWDGPRVVLVVDQFEELFTLRVDEGQRRAFITALHAAATAGHGPDQVPASLVVLGLRADYEALCADYPQLAGAVQDQYLVTSMTERQLWMAITEPARKAGAQVDDDLVGALLTEARTSESGVPGAGALAWLSHALDQAWRCRTGEVVTLADYEQTGGIGRATAESAQRVYERLTPAQQGAARQVFTRLVAAGSDGVDTADRATRAELTEGKDPAEAGDVEEVLEAFAAERLLTCGAGTVEISHPALLAAWPLLRDTWLADTHADRVVRTRLHHTSAEWARHSRDPSYLYTGSLLRAAAETAARIRANPARYLPLSQAERDFLHASDDARRHRTHRQRAFLAILAVLTLCLAATMVFAVHASEVVAQKSNELTSGGLLDRSQKVSGTNPALSKLLSIVAWRVDPYLAATGNAMRTAAEHPGIAVLTGRARGAGAVALSRDGTAVAVGTAHGTVAVWRDVASRWQQVATLPGHGAVAVNRDGTAAAVGTAGGSVVVWRDVASGWRQVATLAGRGGAVDALAWSPGGRAVAVGTAGGSVVVWRAVASGWRRVATLRGHDGAVDAVAFNQDGKAVAVGTARGTVALWRAIAPAHLLGRPLPAYTGPVDSVAFSQNGKTLPRRNFHQAIRLWNVTTPRRDLPKTGLVPYLCALAGQTITKTEWSQKTRSDSPYRTICF
jgi:hypothetical protein